MHIVIIGAGPGGYEAAIKAAQLGQKVTLIEQDRVGGTCLNRGCIPTKTLLHAADILRTVKRSGNYGIMSGQLEVDYSKTLTKKAEVMNQLVSGIEFLLKKNKVEVVYGKARFTEPKTVDVSDTEGRIRSIKGDAFIIATGSQPSTLPVEGIELPQVVDSTRALELPHIPGQMIIVGGGVIGVEFAAIFSEFGSKVTIIEQLPSILATVDSDMASLLHSELQKNGVEIYTDSQLKRVQRKTEQEVTVHFSHNGEDHTVDADCVLVSIGRKANIEGLNLDAAGVLLDKGYIQVDDCLRTAVPHIYAIGDVKAGGLKLAHTASHEGIIAVENVLGEYLHMDYKVVPSCVFTNPEIAVVGLTEQQAKDAGYKVKMGTFSYSGNGKALSMDAGTGMVKVVAEQEYGQILGVHIIGEHASDMIHEAALAIYGEFDTESVGSMIHAHPTLSEMIMEAAMDCEGMAIHNPPKKKR